MKKGKKTEQMADFHGKKEGRGSLLPARQCYQCEDRGSRNGFAKQGKEKRQLKRLHHDVN